MLEWARRGQRRVVHAGALEPVPCVWSLVSGKESERARRRALGVQVVLAANVACVSQPGVVAVLRQVLGVKVADIDDLVELALHPLHARSRGAQVLLL